MFDKSFLEDEVRLGFYIPATIKQAWAAQLEVLKVIDEICRKCNIKYFADWGTFLGAVRHHGYIPWDDDMDLVMLREDYDKFFKEAPALLPEGYSIHTFRNEEGFREFHAVVVNTPSARFDKEHFDKFHGFNYLCGIDIFVLDYLYKDEENEDIRDKDALYLISFADSILDNNLPNETIRANLKQVEKICDCHFVELNIHNSTLKQNSSSEKTIFYSLNDESSKHNLWIKLYELADKICAKVTSDESDTLTQMVPWGLKKDTVKRYPKGYYEKSIRIPFENTDVPVPLFYDKLLTQRYGNYMLIHKAGGAHEYPFFEKQIKDLEALMDFSLPKYTFENAETEESKNGNESESWKSLLKEGFKQLSDINSAILSFNASSISDAYIQEILNSVCDAQELAIDIGNLIESIKGENCPVIALISEYCENLFHLHESLSSKIDVDNPAAREDNLDSEAKSNGYDEGLFSSIKKSFDVLSNDINSILERQEIVFLPFKASAWGSFKELYDYYAKDENTDVYVIPIPYFYKEYDGTLSDIQYDLDSYPEDLYPIPYDAVSLEFLHPDIIFIQNPYDEFNAATSIHPDFYSSKLKNCTDNLVYIPWFKSCEINEEDLRAYKNMQYYVTVPGVVNSEIVLVKTEQEKKMYIKKLTEWSSKDIWSEKIMLLSDYLPDIINDSSMSSAAKTILYYIGAGQVLQNEKSFINKLNSNLNLFKESRERICVYIVEDSRLQSTMEQFSPELKESYQKILTDYSSIINQHFCTDDQISSEYYNLDAYYGDASFLACEYSCSHKPVMIQNYEVYS